MAKSSRIFDDYTWGNLSLALMLLTRIYIPLPGGDDHGLPGGGVLVWFVPIGVLMGGLISLSAWLGGWLLPGFPAGVAFLLLLLSVALSGGLHLDGLADWADAFWCPRDAQQTIRILKDSRVGVYAIVAVSLIFCGKLVALTTLVEKSAWGYLLLAFAVSRGMMVVAAASASYLPGKGGMAKALVDSAGATARMQAILPLGLLAILLAGLPGFALLGAAWGATAAIVKNSQRRIGGINGDILGTVSEICEALVLFGGAIIVAAGS